MILLLKAEIPAYDRHEADGKIVHVNAHFTRAPSAKPTTPPVISFRSGASAPNILRGYVVAGVPVGISLAEMGPDSASWDIAAGYAARGGKVFVDSGAFTAFTKGKPVDWDRVISLYQQMSADAPGARLHLVAPDVVGDQDASLKLLSQYREPLRKLIDQGHDLLVPVQKGLLPPYHAWREAAGMLGTDDFTPSVPSNKVAFSPEDLANLFDGPDKPKRVHLLGIAGDRKRLAELTAVIHSRSPTTVITTDANRLRAQVGEGRVLTVEKGRQTAWLKEAFASLLDDPKKRALFLAESDRILAPAVQAISIHSVETRGRKQGDLFGTDRGEVR